MLSFAYTWYSKKYNVILVSCQNALSVIMHLLVFRYSAFAV